MKDYKLYSPGTVLINKTDGIIRFYTVHHIEILDNGIFYYFKNEKSDGEFIRMALNYLTELNITEI